MSDHPAPEEAEVIRADQLKIGDALYAASGWLSGPREHDGCWRRVTSISDARTVGSGLTERDLHIVLQQFEGEPRSLGQWCDNHTLVIIRKRDLA